MSIAHQLSHLQLAGVSDDEIVADYALTKDGLAPYLSLILLRFADNAQWQAHPEGGRRLLSAE